MILSLSVVLFVTSSSSSTAQFGEALFPSSKLDMACSSSVNNSVLEKKFREQPRGGFATSCSSPSHSNLTISKVLPQQAVGKAFPGIFPMVSLLYQPQSPLLLLPRILFPNSQLFCQVGLPQVLKQPSKLRTRAALLITNPLVS